jgi:hypothetical protein
MVTTCASGSKLRESLSSSEDRFALRIAAGKPKLELLVEEVAKHQIEERGILVRVSTTQTGEQRIPATDKLDVPRHPSSIRASGYARFAGLPALGVSTILINLPTLLIPRV